MRTLLDRVMTERTIDFLVTPPLEVEGESAPLAPLERNTTYLSIIVKSLRLPIVRNKATRYNGLVHAFADIAAAGRGSVQLASATTPTALVGLDPANASRVITIDRTVVGPTPWSGGPLRLQLGLFSVVEQDLAGPFLATLTAISEKAGGALATTAQPLLDVLNTAVGAFASKTGTVQLEIGLDKTFRDPVMAGHYAVVAAPSDQLANAKFTVSGSDGRLLKDGTLYKDRAYVVFTIEGGTEQAAWADIPQVRSAYEQVQAAADANDLARVKSTMEAFHRTMLLCTDLTREDAERLYRLVQERMKAAFGDPNMAHAESKTETLPKLSEIGLYPRPESA